jgi:hypothetical protein
LEGVDGGGESASGGGVRDGGKVGGGVDVALYG